MINGKYHVIDAHCHIYPQIIAQAAIQHTDAFYEASSVYKGTVDDLLFHGKNAGIDQFIVQSVATTTKQVTSINRFVAKEVEKNPDTLIGLGTLHPESTDLRGDLEYLLSLGLRGVKLHPDIQDFKIDDFRYLKIFELCEQYKVPILMHTGDNRYDRSNPNRLYPIMQTYTGLTVIAAHLGGWSIWEQAAEKLHDLPNLYVDCSSSFYYLEPDIAKKIISCYGTDRVLFGTDYPMWSIEKEIEYFLSLGFEESEYRKMFSDNCKNIFNLE